jgi:L-lactate dehydrogenase
MFDRTAASRCSGHALSNWPIVVSTTNVHRTFLAADCVLIIGIQPFEIITQLCAMESVLPSHRIIAPGTMIDSAHFRFIDVLIDRLVYCLSSLHRLRLLIGEKLEISPSSITGLIVGGHADNNLPLWNSITVGTSDYWHATR